MAQRNAMVLPFARIDSPTEKTEASAGESHLGRHALPLWLHATDSIERLRQPD